jgi:phosphatidylglycerol---prolipoprotein diacylglyceryl transferase
VLHQPLERPAKGPPDGSPDATRKACSVRSPPGRVNLPGVTVSPHPLLHPIFETIGYALAYAMFRRSCARGPDFLHGELDTTACAAFVKQSRGAGELIEDDQRWLIIATAAIGALLGSRILGLLEQVLYLHITWRTFLLPGGRTTVGGLLGGWIAVGLIKRLRGIRGRAGDLFAVPLCLGIAIGRIGCFLAGPADGTYGAATSLPWGVNFGDGIPRHPTQLYEILFLSALGFFLHRYSEKAHPEGAAFRIFLVAYLAWRLVIDFLKPQPLIFGLNLIQWACVAGILALLPELMRLCLILPTTIRSTE